MRLEVFSKAAQVPPDPHLVRLAGVAELLGGRFRSMKTMQLVFDRTFGNPVPERLKRKVAHARVLGPLLVEVLGSFSDACRPPP